MASSTEPPHKVVLVTGGSAGLGAAIARVFAADHRVVINYANNKARADDLVKALSDIPCTHPSPQLPRFHTIGADVGDRNELQRLVDETVETFGRLDVVISNAGWTRLTNFAVLDENVVGEDWDRCFNYNVKSHLFLMHAAKKHLEQSEGAFLLTTSIAGVRPSGSSLAYSVTKSAQIHLMKGLAVSCAPKIRVNCVSPGLLLTEWGMRFSEEKREAYKQNTQLKRVPTLEDVAQQFRTFAQSQSTTGQNILIDGGLFI